MNRFRGLAKADAAATTAPLDPSEQLVQRGAFGESNEFEGQVLLK
jgi:hypothetical protein